MPAHTDSSDATPRQVIDYDAFLSHASEDKPWCERLAERLRDEGVRVWFDAWELQPGDHLLVRVNDGLRHSRKLIAVWTRNYFRDEKVWTVGEMFSRQHPDLLAQERPIIPLLRDNCEADIPPTLRNLLSIDFCRDDDFDLHVRELIQALDLPQRTVAEEIDEETLWRAHALDRAGRGRRSYESGSRFANTVADLYRLLGFEVKQDEPLSGIQLPLVIERRMGGLRMQAVVECKDTRITATERDQILARQSVVQRQFPRYRWIAVSSQGFTADSRAALDAAGVDCITYAELLHDLVPLDRYVTGLITDYEAWVQEHWQGDDWFIRPTLVTDITYESRPALTHLSRWLGDRQANLLVLLGDLGTGKSTLTNFLTYHLACSFRDDPLRHPAPVLIPLKDVRKENSLESMIISHFSSHGLPDVRFSHVMHLVRLGNIILLFDAFDEMADRVRWEVTQGNFRELRRAAELPGKVLLTCRTHYFKDRDEQVRVIGTGPRLSEVETALYRELRQQLGAEVVYLQEFDDTQIRAYLAKARPYTVAEDWRKIQNIHNLQELAHRPLLLDMIVKSLPSLDAGTPINAAQLYTVYTNFWIDREEQEKGRFLVRDIKLALMLELAWQLWHTGESTIHYRDLIAFVRDRTPAGIVAGDEEAFLDLARELQTASFLRRIDDAGHFAFMHRSFLEYFLARKLLVGCVTSEGVVEVLRTRRLDRKVVYFLTLLDEDDQLCALLQRLLQQGYVPQVSENALQILYWSGRIRLGMEDTVTDLAVLRTVLEQRIPPGAQLAGAQLQEIVLEAATLRDADCHSADLTRANLNHACLAKANLRQAVLVGARLEESLADGADFGEANVAGASFNAASLSASAWRGANVKEASFLDIKAPDVLIQALSTRPTQLWPVVQRGPAAGINVVACSPDGTLLASGGSDGVIRLYRVSDGHLLHVLEGHRDAVTSVAFTPGGMLLASGSQDCSVRLWEVAQGRQVRLLASHQDWVTAVAFTPDGALLASGSHDYSVRLWEVAQGRQVRLLASHQDWVTAVAFTPDGALLASGSGDRSVRLWEVAQGRQVRLMAGYQGWVTAVAFTPDGALLASGSEDHSVRLWEVAQGRQVRVCEGHYSAVTAVAFTPDGALLASGSEDHSVRLWEVAQGRQVRVCEGHQGSVTAVAFTPDGALLASGSGDRSVRLWEVAQGRQVRLMAGYQGWVTAVAFTPDGALLASGSEDHSVRLWEVAQGRQVRVCEGHYSAVTAVAFTPDGALLASGSEDHSVRLWEVAQGRQVRVCEGHQGSVTAVAFTPDGALLASGSEDHSVRLWEVAQGRLQVCVFEGHQGSVTAVAFTPDGILLASGSEDRSVRLWEVAQGRRRVHVFEGHQGSVTAVAFAFDGILLASGSEDHSIRLWEVAQGRQVRIFGGHYSAVTAVAFTPDGALLVSGSEDHSIRLWEVAQGRLVHVLEGHLGPVSAVAIAPNGTYLVAAGAAGRLQFWDIMRGETFLYRYSFGPGAWLDLLPDGRFDASPEGMRYLGYTEPGTLKAYRAEELQREFYDPEAVRAVLAKYVGPSPQEHQA